ncbi:hypothetical protein HOP52_16025 [Halomonas campisalis]|uniref:Uncharacterized protein n=1 Tax=Billgrantia campisalis TaxID=74661 RepID=A0ABS9PBW9_9GAMM|nr:hypothetical protein [Halomonas campisalis]MCG6659267.1 hypothetical protein [Halomonas campisalis]MDR5864266.1 hypothetical protein [Halomonas campisalis]
MRSDVQARPDWVALVAMLVAAALALWLLLRPELISALPMPVRLPLIALGVWALGAAFMRPLGLELRRHWQRRAASPPWSLVALGVFTLILLLRALWLT